MVLIVVVAVAVVVALFFCHVKLNNYLKFTQLIRSLSHVFEIQSQGMEGGEYGGYINIYIL